MADVAGIENRGGRRKKGKGPLPTRPDRKEDTDRDPRSDRRQKITVVCRLFQKIFWKTRKRARTRRAITLIPRPFRMFMFCLVFIINHTIHDIWKN